MNEKETFILDGKEIKPILINYDIPEEMKDAAFELAFESIEKFTVEKDIADYIKIKFDEKFLDSWQCVVGKDYACSLTHESQNFIFFSIENTYFLIFKL